MKILRLLIFALFLPQVSSWAKTYLGDSSPLNSANECENLLLPSEEVLNSRAHTANIYLERRATLWVDQSKCISCHTVLPLVVGRTDASAVNTEAFTKIKNLVVSRVERPELPKPWYGADRSGTDRTHSSHATESVLNALILAQMEHLTNETPSSATLLAFERMKTFQSEDGSWEWLNFNLLPWETSGAAPYGATLAAVAISKSQLKMDFRFKSMIDSMKSYLKTASENHAFGLWNRMSILWANSTLGDILSEEVVHSTLTEILTKQLEDGGWSMNDLGDWKKKGTHLEANADSSDGYATAYTLYILKQLKSSRGVPGVLQSKFDSIYQHGVNWLVDHQTPEGTWNSASLNYDKKFNRTLVEDAATGFALDVLNRTQL